jgi:tetratricopeptide (TPR) repeat protein
VADEPVPPRGLQPGVPRDLETVCLKCLQKEPARRYASAQDLADDLQHFQNGEPVRARPVGPAGRLGRWARRNPKVASLLAVLALVVAAGLTTVTALWLRAEEHRARAQDNYARAEDNANRAEEQRRQADTNFRFALQAVDDYCTKVAQDERLKEKDLEPLRKELLQTAVLFYQEFVREHAADPAVRAELGSAYTRLASLTADIGEPAKAIGFYQQALAVWEELAGANPAEPSYQDRQASCHYCLALLYRDTRRPQDAEKSHLRALDIQETLVAHNPTVADYQSARARSHDSLGNLYRRAGRLDEAERACTKARDILQELNGTHPGVSEYQLNLSVAQNNLGILYLRTHRPGQAEKAYQASIRILKAMPPRESATARYQDILAGTYANLGNLYYEGAQMDRAVEAFNKVAEIAGRLVNSHPAITKYQSDLAAAHNGLGNAYLDAGRMPEAEAAYRKACEIRKSLAQKNPLIAEYTIRLGGSYGNLGSLALRNHRFQEGLDWYTLAIEAVKPEQQYASARRFLHNTYFNRSLLWSAQDKFAEALKDLDRAIALEGGPGEDQTRSQRALVLARQGQYARAVEEVKGLKGDRSKAIDQTVFNSACVYALASAAARGDPKVPAADRNQLAEGYAGRARDLLGQARAAGYFNVPAHLQELKSAKDLDSLRHREDFKKLLDDVEKAAGQRPGGKTKRPDA